MEHYLQLLSELRENLFLFGFSALDVYFKKKHPFTVQAATEASLIDLAKAYDDLQYPGHDFVDALLSMEHGFIYFTSIDSKQEIYQPRILPLTLLYDVHQRKFIDTEGVYPYLREKTVTFHQSFTYPFTWEEIGELAVLISRYHYVLPDETVMIGEPVGPLGPFEQQLLLNRLLTSQNGGLGFSFLMKSGFIKIHWPELEKLNSTEHSKEFHPEGNVWEHTINTINQRKSMDISLGLGLLLHDIGKPESEPYQGNQFYRHAQIGSYAAGRFLERLLYPKWIIENVVYLVRNHMLPAAIDKIPVFKTENVLTHPMFSFLLELYRCDLASSYRDLDRYYAICKTYRKYMKNKTNPYRDRAGKKFTRMYQGETLKALGENSR